ncbi:hypothetical protein Tco_0242252 [Tanacetum coccineum]
MDECLALADLGSSALFSCLFPCGKKLSLPELTPTCMTLELANRSISRSVSPKIYSSNYDDNLVNRIDVIDMACGEYSQEVPGFSDVIARGNPTPYYDQSDFLLEEVDAFLALEDDPTSPEVDHSYYDPEGDILLLEAFLNWGILNPSLPPLHHRMYFPEIQKELKIC